MKNDLSDTPAHMQKYCLKKETFDIEASSSERDKFSFFAPSGVKVINTMNTKLSSATNLHFQTQRFIQLSQNVAYIS